MSLKNQKMIAAKIKSIDLNFIPKIEVDSRTTPRGDDELNFMVNLVIAFNGGKNITKIFFDRRVKNCVYSQIHVGYCGDGFELIINMHKLDLNVEKTVEFVDRKVKHSIEHRASSYEERLAKRDAANAAFDAAIADICADVDYEEETKDMEIINRNINVEINGVMKPVNYSTVNGPRVSFVIDDDFDADENSVFKILNALGDDVYFPVEIDGHVESYFMFSKDECGVSR